MNELQFDIESFVETYKANNEVDDISYAPDTPDDIFWTPVDLVKTSFPEKKSAEGKWVREFGHYSLSLQQLEEGRDVPYGLMAREVFDYFYNSFVVNLNHGIEYPNYFRFNSVSEFVNLVKNKPLNTKVASAQRVSALETLLNMESCAIRLKEPKGEHTCASSTDIFIRKYSGPFNKNLALQPSTTTNGEIEVELDYETFSKLYDKKRVPTKSYLVDLAGSNVTARDLIIFIASQCYSLSLRRKEYIDIPFRDLRQILGLPVNMAPKDFSKAVKRAINTLTERYEQQIEDDFFPAEVISKYRGNVLLRIYKPKKIKNILCKPV